MRTIIIAALLMLPLFAIGQEFKLKAPDGWPSGETFKVGGKTFDLMENSKGLYILATTTTGKYRCIYVGQATGEYFTDRVGKKHEVRFKNGEYVYYMLAPSGYPGTAIKLERE